MDFYTEATFVNGVMRWRKTGRVPASVNVYAAFYQGFPVDIEKTERARAKDDQAD